MENLINLIVKEIETTGATATAAGEKIIGDKLEGCFKTYAIKESAAIIIDKQWMQGIKEDHDCIKEVVIKDGYYNFTFKNDNCIDVNRSKIRLHGWADTVDKLRTDYLNGMFND